MDSGTAPKSTHILLLEDDRAHQELVLRAFRGDPDQFRVSVAGTLREARQLAEDDPPDLIIADWILPDGKGLDILSRQEGMVTIPLIIMTSFGDEHLAVEIMKSGAIDYVVKSATAFHDMPHIVRRAIRDWENIKERKRAEGAVQESERKYRFLLGNVRDIVWQTTPDLTFTYLSPATETLTGYRPEDLLGTSFFEILTDPSARIVRERLRDRMENYSRGSRDLATVFETEILKRDGGQLWLEISSNAVFDSEGIITGFQGIGRDITDRKRAERALQVSEERFRDLFSNMSAGVVIYEPTADAEDFIIRDVNRAAETIEKLKKIDIIGRSVLEVFPGVVEFGLFAVFQRVARTGIAESHPVSLYHDNRITGWRENYVYKLPSREIVAVYEDVTAKKQAEEKLRESEEKARSLMNVPTIGAFIIDCDGILLDVNETVLKGYATTAEQILGKSVYDLSSPPVSRRRKDRVEEAIRSRTMVRYDDENQGRFHDIVIMPLTDSRGEISRLAVVAFDITEQKMAQNALAESEERYRALLFGAGIGVGYWSTDGTLLLLNEISLKRLRGTEKDFIGKSMQEIFAEKADIYLDRLHKATLSSEPVEYEDYISLPAGKGWYLSVYTRITRPDGSVLGIQVLSIDVTERRQAEDALRESRQLLEGILNTIPARVFWKNTNLTYLGCNTAFARDAGYDKPEDLIGRDDYSMAWREQAELYRNDDLMVIESGKPNLMIEEPQTTPDGKTMYLLTNKVPLLGPGGEVIGILGTYLDITERKKAEETRKAYEARLDAAMEIGSLAWWEMDLPDGNVRFDDRKATMLGYPTDKFRLFSDFTSLLHPEDYEQVMQAMRDHLEGRAATYQADYRILAAGGEYRWFRDIGGITGYHPDGTPSSVTGIVIDITERRIAEENLRESEAKYRLIYDTAREGIWGVDADYRVQYVNPHMADMLGYSVPEILGRPVTDFVTAGEEQDAEQRFAHRRTGLAEQFERKFTRKDGTVITLIVSATPRMGDDGTFKGSFAMFTDITERKQMDEQLRASETRFRALIQNSSDIIRILDREGRIVYESPSSERILGYPPGFMVGRNPLEYIPPEDLGRVKNDFQQVLDKENTGSPTEFRIRKANGEYLWVDSIATNLVDIPGVNGIVVTTRPIQQRKEAEQALSESEERLRLALEGADIASWDWDLTSGNAVFSDRFYTMLDYEPGEFPATYDQWAALMHPDDRERVLPDLDRQIREKRPLCEIEYRLKAKDGNWIWILGKGKIAGSDDRGNPTRLTGVNIDITNRRLLESEIRSLNTVLEQRVRDRTEALARTNKELEEEVVQRHDAERKLKGSYDEKVLLLKEIHHRVKNNLQIIASLLNLQSRYIKDAASLAVIRESQNRVKAMALVHEKLYRAEDIAHIALYDYVRFLGTGLFQFYDAKVRGIQFTLDIHDVNVDIDAAIPLGLILNELISNSLKYAFPEGRKGEVAVSVKKEGPVITVQYRDNGIGIPADLDWRDTESLGLRLVNTLVDQMNGTIELDRTAGTLFTMVLHEKEHREQP